MRPKGAPDAPVEVRAECRVHASEDPERVVKAVRNVISNSVPEHRDGRVVAVATGPDALATIYEQVRSRQVVNVLKRRLLENMVSSTTWFYLNKQAAYAGTVVICEEETESPLGPIKVTISSKSLESVVNWLTPL